MARIRTIKPEFWEDEKLSNIPMVARLFYIGSWNFADDQGVVRAAPKVLKAKIFPYDEITILEIEELCRLLVKVKMFIPLKYEGESYFIIRTFKSHQKIDIRYARFIIPSDLVDLQLNVINHENTSWSQREHDVTTSQESIGEESIGRGEEEDGITILQNGSPPQKSIVEGKRKKVRQNALVSFEDSKWFDRAVFDSEVPPEWDAVKIQHYWEAAVNHSNKGGKYKNWIVTVVGWEKKDRKSGSNKHPTSNGRFVHPDYDLTTGLAGKTGIWKPPKNKES